MEVCYEFLFKQRKRWGVLSDCGFDFDLYHSHVRCLFGKKLPSRRKTWNRQKDSQKNHYGKCNLYFVAI